jgi:hypothetical protein
MNLLRRMRSLFRRSERERDMAAEMREAKQDLTTENTESTEDCDKWQPTRSQL